MAKQPETIDRFRIFAETSSEAMGPLLAQLTRMGLENIGYELITDVRRFQANGSRKMHDISVEEHAALFIKDHPTFKAGELVKHFEAAERHKSGAYTAMRAMVESGSLIKLGNGNYRRADVKAIAPPAEKTRRGQSPRYDVSNDDLLLKYIRPRKSVSVADAGLFLEREGRNKNSASPIISRFTKAGLLKLIEPGLYSVVQKKLKGKAKSNEAKKKADRIRAQAYRDKQRAAKLNGQQPGEAAHG